MQSESSLQELSRLRSALGRLLKDLRRSVDVVFARTPLVKGNVYEMVRKCGKPSCVCSRGEMHRSMVLSWSDRGKTRLLSIPAERLGELRSKSQAYLRFRQARARVSKIHKEMLLLLDRIEELRREAP